MLNKLFRTKDGDIVLGQKPNIPLILWLMSLILSWVTEDSIAAGFSTLASAAILTWAYLEISDGVNLFRRVLGVVVASVVIGGLFL